jgi:hypothetical protein
MTISCLTVGVSREQYITKRTGLDENIQVTTGDGAVNPAFLMKSEDESAASLLHVTLRSR